MERKKISPSIKCSISMCMVFSMLFVSLLSLPFFGITINNVVAGLWNSIWEPDDSIENDTIKAIEKGFFWSNNVVLILSSHTSLQDPNRENSLWYGPIPEDPNSWELTLWNKEFFLENKKIETLFTDPNFLYFCLSDANSAPETKNSFPIVKRMNTSFELDADIEVQYGDISKIYEGAIFHNSMYLGVLKDNGECELLKGTLPDPTFSEEEEINFSDPNRRITVLKVIDDHLYLTVEALDANDVASLYRISDGDEWEKITEGSYTEESNERIPEFITIEKVGSAYWLFCRCLDASSDTYWRVYKTDDLLSSAIEWRHAISINFNDPNIVILDIQPCPIDEYLYMGISSSAGSSIVKSYKDEGWEDLSESIFDPNDYFNVLFADPNDNNYIYAGVSAQDEDSYIAKLHKRFVPRIDIEHSYVDRFYNTQQITFDLNNLKANWDESETFVPEEVSFISYQKIGEETDSNSPNIDANSIYIDSNSLLAIIEFGNEEGLYAARFNYIKTDDNEQNEETVTKDVLLCYDSTSPATPTLNSIQEGNKHLPISWAKSTDSLEYNAQDLYFEDPNFHESIKEYHVQYQMEDEQWEDPNDTSFIITIAAYYDANRIQQEDYGYDIKDLQNDSTYKVRVRARDRAGNTSSWSEEGTGTPYKPIGVLDITGEESKCFISLLDEKEKKRKEAPKPRWIVGVRAENQKFQDDTIALVYNDDSYGGRIALSYKSSRWIENSLELGYYQMSGYGLHPGSLQQGIDSYYFHILPLSTTLRILPFGDREWFMHPFIGGGFDCWFYREDDGDSHRDSYLTGYHGVCALRFLMDKIEPREAELFKESYGVLNTYLTLGIQWNQIDDFSDEGLDLSGKNVFIEVEFFF
ncbi:MAG: fibronectin type III domain-containing protein [bacterium]